MDQDCGVWCSGSFLSLSEQEQSFYSGLHGLCQSHTVTVTAAAPAAPAAPHLHHPLPPAPAPAAENTGNLSSVKVAELFKASGLHPELLHRVTEVCGARQLGYFGTPQFYVALKLLAAAQAGLPVRLDSVTATNLPLPRFVGMKNEAEMRYSSLPLCAEAQCGSGSWTPADRSSFRRLEATVEKKEPWSPPRSPHTSPPLSPATYRSYSCVKHKNGADSQIIYEGTQTKWPLAQLEQHSSPNKYASKPTVEHPVMTRASSSERINRPDVDDYCDTDPWRITEEQLDYYTNQFRSLQPDLGALILGSVAKNFFTKSKLPIPELSHIWELSDVDRDGALTFSEFCTAFHLIVARKNGYALPESLPVTLRPQQEEEQEEQEEVMKMKEEENMVDTPASTEPLIVFEDDAAPRHSHMSRSRFETSLTKQSLKEESCQQDDDLTRATTSQQKPVLPICAFPQRPEPPQDLDPQMRTRTRPRSYSSTSFEDALKKTEEPPTPPPRPQKTHSRASSLDLNKLLQQGAPGVKSAGWLLPPPALPPRPSASQVSHFISATEKSAQSSVQQPNFADFSHFKEEEEISVKPEDPCPPSRFVPSAENLTSKQDVVVVAGSSQVPQKPVRKKYHAETQSAETLTPPSVPPTAAASFPHPTKPAQKQKREIQTAIRKNRETNAVLTRLNSELQQQLKVVHRQRVALESQLDLLRPLTST
ncbi:ralBP1-associated Eps domain-containing protein 2 [Solea senegalensis]|uniref:RalBP1-associated Eps domain-containing protein 2 n=1 Tax=Solea senegalensis TaxID=28829 RepID=A0AAV6S7K1_SOLSE|nr:ralBP1-associated Eps domain-containing protein 2 [Solea senegalensis]KAG7513389.1 ralBP1-associated Eps domain-containing protein 2 [Solea senegalensis]